MTREELKYSIQHTMVEHASIDDFNMFFTTVIDNVSNEDLLAIANKLNCINKNTEIED